MTLEDFEKDLAVAKASEDKSPHQKDGQRSQTQRHRRHQGDHERSAHHDGDDRHRSKRLRHSHDDDGRRSGHRNRHKHKSRHDDDHDDDGRVKPNEETDNSKRSPVSNLQRDSWMEAPSALQVDYVQRPRREEPSPVQIGSLGMNHSLQLHKNELNRHLHNPQDEGELDGPKDQLAEHVVDYTFGDSGSQWRMTKLKAVYRKADDTGRKVEAVALERYDSVREFDDAREEEIELSRRETYGDGYVGKEKPSGELFQERKLEAGIRATSQNDRDAPDLDEVIQGTAVLAKLPFANRETIDQTTLNRMKAQLMKARIRKDPKLSELEREFEEVAATSSNSRQADVVTLSAMDNRSLSSAPRNEVKVVTTRRGQERGQVEENEDMSIEDMVREERRTKHQSGGDGQRFAERIAKDAKFDNDLDYMDENASKLAKRVHKSDINIRNIAIGDYQKMNRILDDCPLCHHEDTRQPPVAPIVSLGTRTYLTLPTEPELGDGGAVIVPIQHRTNLLECDDDEWEEVRNFMKSLTRLYHDQGRAVIFYENAARPNRKPHAALNAIPLPYSLGEMAPAFFQEAFLSSEDEWSQHKKVIDTLKKSKEGLGKAAFRRSLVKEMPYFHVWFEIDGGVGHIVEDEGAWPRGDLFAREIIGGMLDLDVEVMKRQGKWHRGLDGRVEGFKKRWRKFDWTRVLTEG